MTISVDYLMLKEEGRWFVIAYGHRKVSMESHAPDCVGDVPFLSLEYGLYSENSDS